MSSFVAVLTGTYPLLRGVVVVDWVRGVLDWVCPNGVGARVVPPPGVLAFVQYPEITSCDAVSGVRAVHPI